MVIRVHVLGLLITFLLRLALFIAGHHLLSEESASDGLLQSRALLNGVWFDNVIGCYFTLPILLAITIGFLLGYMGKRLLKPCLVWLQAFWILVFLISAANIPYFLYFFKNINSSIWNWAEYGYQTLGMVFGEPSYYPPLIGFLILSAGFIALSSRCLKKVLEAPDQATWKARPLGLLLGLALMGGCAIGIRGRLGYNPIRVSAAYYCQDPFLNQLGISPAFNLMTSTMDTFRKENRILELTSGSKALEKAAAFYDWGSVHAVQDTLRVTARPNVVLIFMESMSYDLTGLTPRGKNLTPFLNDLASRSLLFTRFYSSGIHTNHGMFSTLYSYPVLMQRNMMKGTIIPHYEGLPTVLRDEGYRTLFFMTHESQYDNMNAFFRTNGYEEIYAQEDYPKEKVVNHFGVQDDFLYSYALDRLDEISVSGQRPFFATLLSISNHPPYVLPEGFKAKSRDIEDQIVEYADKSLEEFFSSAKEKDWFPHTIFILVGDHGKLVHEAESEMPESYNHIPMMIYRPGQTGGICDSWAMQMDIQPTLLNLLGIPDRLDHFGIDLLEKRRPMAFYTSDDIMGARSEGHFYVFRPGTSQEFLYRNGVQVFKTDSVFDDLKDHLFFNIQATQEICVDRD